MDLFNVRSCVVYFKQMKDTIKTLICLFLSYLQFLGSLRAVRSFSVFFPVTFGFF